MEILTGAASESVDPLLAGLNPQQRTAVEHRGPALLIVAGAGSGKTRVLTHRIAHLIRQRDAWPSQILAITFTNKAAGEMRERIHQLLGEDASGMWISTFHSACVRILRREAQRFGYPESFTIYDSQDSRAVLKRILKELDADVLGFTPANAGAKISRLKNELADAESVARNVNQNDPRDVLFAEIFARYEAALRRAKAFDFDDLIGQTVFLFRAFPDVAAQYRRRFRHILVDEYQDTNHAQYALIHELTRPVEPEDLPAGPPLHVDETGRIPGASLTVVGDSDQSIYAFRGADERNIAEFERDFPGAEVVLLEQNYRSTQTILDAANAVIGHNFDRKDKRLWTDQGAGELITGFTGYSQHDEAQFVADEIEALRRNGYNYGDIAVFYRTNGQTRALEEMLIRSGVPYRVIGGTRFFERAEVKDVLAYLVSVANPADEQAVRRILNVPKRGIGPATETQLAKFAEDHGITIPEALLRAKELGLGPKVTQALLALGTLLHEVRQKVDHEPVHTLLTDLLNGSGYRDMLVNSKDDQDAARLENVDELVAQARDFQRRNAEGGLVDYLTEVALVAAADELSDDDAGTVSLMTLHTAKGLEFPAVFLTGVEEGLLPHQIAVGEPGGLAEERRLMYVGLTRARKKLFITLAASRAQYGGIDAAIPSRFLSEIPAELIDWRRAPGSSVELAGSNVGGWGAASGGWETTRPRTQFGGSSRSVGTGRDRFGVTPLPPAERPVKKDWAMNVTASVRDNGDLQLSVGDRVRHSDFGEGTVRSVIGEGAKQRAEIDFGASGRKTLLVKIAPIERV